jgi:hypothetical protein
MTRRAKLPNPAAPVDRRAHLAAAQQSSMLAQSRIAEHDAREEQRMINLSRRAERDMLTLADLEGGSIPPLSRSDVMLPGMSPRSQLLTEEFPTSHDTAIMQEIYNGPKPSRSRPLTETTRPARHPSWTVKKFLGETRGGTTVAVWKVQNSDSGIAFDKLFRIESVAFRIASLLNESNNIGDPRVVSVLRDYDKRDKLLKEARVLERETGDKPMKQSRLRAVRAEIASLDYKLGI